MFRDVTALATLLRLTNCRFLIIIIIIYLPGERCEVVISSFGRVVATRRDAVASTQSGQSFAATNARLHAPRVQPVNHCSGGALLTAGAYGIDVLTLRTRDTSGRKHVQIASIVGPVPFRLTARRRNTEICIIYIIC